MTGKGRKGKRPTGSDVDPGAKPLRGDLPPPGLERLLTQAKLSRPETASKAILRPRLLSRLNDGLDKRVTLISAPAGCGKTTLAAQWLGQSKLRSGWVTLERDDDDPERFLRYVVAGIRTAVPEFGAKIWALLSAVQLPPPGYIADAMVSELETLGAPVLLVLDDYHLIASQAVHEMVLRILTHMPRGGLHLIFLTRLDPPWPLARWRSAEELNELRGADLAFSEEETALFFNRYDFGPDTLDILRKRTEGWITGLQLIKLSLGSGEDPERIARTFSEKDRLLVDYLMDEVISRQPGNVRDFLSVTAMLDRFCAPLCDLLLANGGEGVDAGTMISRLERENLFIVPLDRERYWYRYHHLFRNFLEQHLTRRIPRDRAANLHRLAGKWFAGQGMVEEAIKEYLSIGEVDEAAVLLELYLDPLIGEDLSRRRLKHFLELFPPGAERESPILLVGEAHVKSARWEFPAAMQLLDQAEALLRCGLKGSLPRRRGVRIQKDIEAQRGMCRYWAGDVERAHRHALKALRIMPKEHPFARCLAAVYATLSYAMKGRRDEGVALSSAHITQGVADRSPFIGPPLIAQLAIHFYAGDLNAALEAAARMFAIHETVPIPEYWLAYAHYFQGSVAYERNQLDAAADLFHSIKKKPYRVPVPIFHDSLTGLALIALARGKVQEAREFVRSAEKFAVEMNAPASLETSRAMTSWLATSTGEAPVDVVGESAVGESVRPWLLTPSMIRIEGVILRGTPADLRAALVAIEAGLQRAKRRSHTRQVIQFLTLKAVALKRAGRPDGALQVLKKTVRMARPLGFVRTFVDRGPIIADLLADLSEKAPDDLYVRSLLGAFGKNKLSGTLEAVTSPGFGGVPTGHPADDPRTGGLSNRELDVLNLLAERLTNKEIAARLFVSPETVKRHVFNISRKLNVRGRRQAIADARKLGLLQGH